MNALYPKMVLTVVAYMTKCLSLILHLEMFIFLRMFV